MKPQIIQEEPLTMMEVSNYLKKIKKRDETLNLRSQKTEEYVNHFTRLNKKDYSEKEKQIADLNIPRLKQSNIKKILDMMPDDAAQLKSLFQGQVITISDANAKKIVDILHK